MYERGLILAVALSAACTYSAPRPDFGPLQDLSVAGACGVPGHVGPSDLSAGYLAPVKVALKNTIDGDTAFFSFPTRDQSTRFLSVNTEESHGAQTTAFGIQSANTIAGWLAAAGEIFVVLEEGRVAGQPNEDPFNRWLGFVFVDGELFETRIVREGLSAYYTQFGCAPAPVHQALLAAEAEAYQHQRGIWAPGHPTDYSLVLADWIGNRTCRPNPFRGQPYCP
jgi:endonuclease YncB( thermonuclease family)